MSTVRSVPPRQSALHARLWGAVRNAVTSAGGRAWAFQRADAPQHIVEFLEGRPLASILEREDVRRARARLDEAVPPISTEELSALEEE